MYDHDFRKTYSVYIMLKNCTFSPSQTIHVDSNDPHHSNYLLINCSTLFIFRVHHLMNSLMRIDIMDTE